MFPRFESAARWVALCGISCGLTAIAQPAESALTARQLFYTERPKPATRVPTAPKPAAPAPGEAKRRPESKPAPPAAENTPPAPAVAPYLGLRYSVLQLTGNSRLEEVNPDGVFRSGDRIKVRVTPNSSGYLYVVHQGSSGSWDVLFPSAGFRQGSNAVEKLEPLTVPEGDYDFAFDEKTGTERLFVVLSAKPEPDLDALIYSLKNGGGQASQRTMLAANHPVIPAAGIDRFRSALVSRDLRVDRRPAVQSSGKREEAVYVVNASASGDSSRVVAEIALRHQ